MDNFINFSNETLERALRELDKSLKSQVPHSLTYLYLKDDSLKSRLLLRNQVQKTGGLNLVVVSANPKAGGIAWAANVFHFLFLSDFNLFPAFTLFQDRLKKMSGIQPVPRKISIAFRGGMDVINTDEICFINADGNYTEIYLSAGIKKTVTCQLNLIEKKLQAIPGFERIGKSFILNIGKVEKIKENTVFLKTDKEELKLNLSPLYIKRLKKSLSWF